ncbi:response regulator [Streptosporangium pseudovulgare]|uniref:Two-component system response regulator n=1 Tax=Streptosporangium pseudovulgare TaxID=35765 RepID=A0ABQ2R327_9ACTN|nr:response regulator [Streptosporangium pseudovulgare]GGQ06588.1 two-component system response regulator [Streptosporangium pseudovulgare]
MSQAQQPLMLLVIEDDPGDQMLIAEAFADQATDPAPQLVVVSDGQQALDVLYQRGAHEGAARPDLVLLDLNLPLIDGRAVLQHIKADEHLRSIPVVVFTTSTLAEDITSTYLLHANAYVAKPLDFADFTAAVQSISAFFTRTARLPGLSAA